MADVPFFRSPTLPDALTASLALATLYVQDTEQLTAILSSVEPASLDTFHPFDSFSTTWVVCHSASFVFVLTSGIQSSTQGILAIVGSVQGPIAGIPGQVGAYWGGIAVSEFASIAPILSALLPGRRVVLMGHSLGGAISACMLSLIGSAFPGVQEVAFTFGSPRPGNPAFIAATQSQVFNFLNSDDPVPAIPPTTWAGVGSAWPQSGPPPFDTYATWSDSTILNPDGSTSIGDSDLNTLRAAYLFLIGDTGAHQLPEYSRRISVNLPTPPTPEFLPYETPQIVGTVLRSFVPELKLMPFPSNLARVTFFFNYGGNPTVNIAKPSVTRPSCGITEDVWTSLTGIASLQNLVTAYLTARMPLAVDLFSFQYARVSYPLNKRWVDFIGPLQQGGPTQGQLATGSAGGPVGSGDEDAVLMRIKLTVGPSGRIFLHGYNARQENEGTFYPDSNWTANFPQFQAFFTTGANQIFFLYSPAPGTNPTHKISALTPQTPRGFLLTSADGAVPAVGDFISVTGVGRAVGGANGRKIVTTINNPAGSFTVGGASPIGVWSAPVGGNWVLVNPLSSTYNYSTAERLTSHRVGKPFATSRGRKSARLSLRL